MIDPLFAQYPRQLAEACNMFKDHQRYTTVSNIGRIMLLNTCGGIYTDIDFLLPKEEI